MYIVVIRQRLQRAKKRREKKKGQHQTSGKKKGELGSIRVRRKRRTTKDRFAKRPGLRGGTGRGT